PAQAALARCRQPGDDVPLGRGRERGDLGGMRGAAAAARHRGRARRLPRRVRRRVRPHRARAERGGVPARRGDPRGAAVTLDPEEVVAQLDRGELRVAEKVDGEWRVNAEVKQAILDYFRVRKTEPFEVGPFEYRDKIPLK